MASRYIVHGTDETGQPVRKIIEAESAAAASTMASNIGVNVRGVEVDEPAPAPRAATVGGAPAPVVMGPETVVWKGSPSQWTNLKWYALTLAAIAGGITLSFFTAGFGLLLILVPLPWLVANYLKTKTVKITLTSERLRIESGILSKRIEEIELYRVKDTELEKTVWQRVLGLGTVHMVTSDPTMPRITLGSIKNAVTVRENIRQQVERVRRLRGVRELDVADHIVQ